MGMTIDKAISWIISISEHEGEDIPIYDTDAEAIKTAVSTMRKFQKIEQIVNAELEEYHPLDRNLYRLALIKEVIEDEDALNVGRVIVTKTGTKDCVVCYSCDEIDDHKTRLKADMVAMLEEISLEIDEMDCTIDHDFEGYYTGHVDCQKLIREKINALKGEGENDRESAK